MAKLDVYHHKFIMALLILVVLVVGMLFGARLSSSLGDAAMLTLIFGLLFVVAVLAYVLFTQLVHIRDDLAQLRRGKR